MNPAANRTVDLRGQHCYATGQRELSEDEYGNQDVLPEMRRLFARIHAEAVERVEARRNRPARKLRKAG